MDACKGNNGGSSNGSRDNGPGNNNHQPRHTSRMPIIGSAEIFYAVWILLAIATTPVLLQEGLLQVAFTDHQMADGGNITPPQSPEAHPGGLYNCWQCDRSFSSLQGLGGHISGHNRQALMNQMNNHVSVEEGGTSQPPPRKRQRVELIHRCSDCGAVFPTGQALGGHMRAHYTGDLSHARRRQNAKNDICKPNGGALASSSGVNLSRDEHSVAANADNNNVIIPVVENNVVAEVVYKDDLTRASSHHRLNIDLNQEPKEEEPPAEEAGEANED